MMIGERFSGLRRVFYLAVPYTFGKDIRRDLSVIRVLARNVPLAGGNTFPQTFLFVMGSVEEFFSGGAYCPSEEIRTCRRLNHLDSGLAKAFGSCDLETFLSRRKVFLDADNSRPSLEELYSLGVEDVAFQDNDPQVAESARDRAVRAGIHLVLLAHEEQARLDGRLNEAIVSRKLLEIITVTEGAQASQLTRKDVFQALEAAVKEIEQEDMKHMRDTGYIMREDPLCSPEAMPPFQQRHEF